ncbi:AraC family transcriptional regulator [Fulvivirgaceae bacterium BMA12]|uniref:AraC family transcriptional regulator n=1 Tax=Agaribacillus aureus TaxID=3051825 RepID=A0ABT8LA07_9BACT|nr:AraC family transcriptional regulator [Fulvivirgaceae bacterium BMA12]
MKLPIKNMVCNRCIEAVTALIEEMGYSIRTVRLGEAEIEGDLSDEQKISLREALRKRGFDLLEDKNSQLIERIKNLVIASIHRESKPMKTNYSTYLEQEIGRDYSFLSTLFSAVEGLTIEKFIILQRLEKVKELLIYDELNLSEIAYQLHYSSVQHLSNQFKKATGMSPSVFKKRQLNLRNPLDKVGD